MSLATGKTKLVRVTLAALTRVEYNEIVEVPVDITEEDLDRLVTRRYDEVDGGEFVDDPDYWEAGHCYAQEVSEDATPTKRLELKDGDMTVRDIDGN